MLFLISFLTLLTAFLIPLHRINPITRLALLIIIFLMASLIMISLDFYFLGLTYIIVYVGAIAILFLFVIMLLKTHSIEEDKNSMATELTTEIKETTVGIETCSLYLICEACEPINESSSSQLMNQINSNPTVKGSPVLLWITLVIVLFTILMNIEEAPMIYNYFFNDWTSSFVNYQDIHTLGFILYLGYFYGIILLSYLLFIVLIGVLIIGNESSN